MKSKIVFVLMLLCMVGSAIAQERLIRGTIKDQNGAVISGANVVLRNVATGLERVVATDSSGSYEFSELAAAEYEIIVRADGFKNVLQRVTSDRLDISLEISPLKAETTVYSGSRQEELRESLNTKVEVVTRSQIVDTGYESVGEVLKDVPGVQTRLGSDTGTSANVAAEQIQGVGSRQSLVLLDGFPIIAARGIKSGNINLDRQSTSRIEQIEVVKGAASALYGSDAIGGVVNLITREPKKPLEGSVSISGGNFGVFDPRADLGFRKNKLTGFFSFDRHKNNGFDLTPTTFDTTGAGFHRYNYFSKLKYAFSPEFYVTLLADVYTGHSIGRSIGEPDPTRGFRPNLQIDDGKDITQNYGLTGNWTPNSRAVIQLRGYFSRFDEVGKTRLSDGRTLPDDNLYQRFGQVDASATYIWGEKQIIQFGGEWRTDRYRGINRLRDDSGEKADTRTVWGQNKISLTNWAALTLGLRYDDHSTFGSAVSPKIGLNIRATERINLRASWGRGYRAPDLGQLYYRFLNPTNFYQVVGNPNLRPEHSGSWQVGAEYSSTKKSYRFGVNFFRNDVVNLIEAQNFGFLTSAAQGNGILLSQGLNPSEYNLRLFRLLFIYKNLRNIFTQGAEADFGIQIPKGFELTGAYTYLDARDKVTDDYLPERIKSQGFLRLAYDNRKLGFRGNVRASFFSGWRASSLTNRGLRADQASPAFRLVDIYGAKRIAHGFEAFANIENLFDSKDVNVNKFDSTGQPFPILRPDAGRMYRAGLRYTFSRN